MKPKSTLQDDRRSRFGVTCQRSRHLVFCQCLTEGETGFFKQHITRLFNNTGKMGVKFNSFESVVFDYLVPFLVSITIRKSESIFILLAIFN